MWHVKTKAIPLKIEENGTISKTLRKMPEKHRLQGKHKIKELQKKIAIFVTAHIIQKVLM
jgi:hypothetical protein